MQRATWVQSHEIKRELNLAFDGWTPLPGAERAMTRRSSAVPSRQASKSPALLADSEIQHLEKVVLHFCRADALQKEMLYGLSYWLNRIADVERKFHLVPAQVRRLKLLRNILMQEV
jgi:hypothetical protein